MPRKSQPNPIPVIDLFAGPGGLGEGFASFGNGRRGPRFRIALSIEKDPAAHRTLRLRAFLRQFPKGNLFDDYYELLRGEISERELFERSPVETYKADQEAWNAELGRTPHDEVKARIRSAMGAAKSWVLIGGPPCQAYSIAGRSRNRGVTGYRLERDAKHRLYEEYLRIVADHWPPVFVMENVKGLLSTKVREERLFDRIVEDLQDPGRAVGTAKRHRYVLHSLEGAENPALFGADPIGRFVVEAERHGIPQCRHRVILLGVRNDLGEIRPRTLREAPAVPTKAVLQGLPRLRSGLSRVNGHLSKSADNAAAWCSIFTNALGSRWIEGNAKVENQIKVRSLVEHSIARIRAPQARRGAEFVPGVVTVGYEPAWFLDDRIGGACNHSTREHMDRDLHRYLFAACFARVNKRSPRLRDFPPDILPDHKNVGLAMNGGYFNDRFRVQMYDRPATTITSHIHKDGHYYIHPDPTQCRSLTVREAARLQTFPDNYFFTGPRSEQYIQVGNAVPPLLARQIAEIVRGVLDQAGMMR